jgi:fumarate reductase subunit C
MTDYTEYHPRWYRKRVSTYWWMGQWHYTKFILRELSSVAVALFVIMTLLMLRALRAGPEAYARYTHRLASPWMIAFSAIAFLFVLLHTITWFNLAPRAMAVRVRGKRVPEFMIAAPNYALWVVASAAVAWIVLGSH